KKADPQLSRAAVDFNTPLPPRKGFRRRPSSVPEDSRFGGQSGSSLDSASLINGLGRQPDGGKTVGKPWASRMPFTGCKNTSHNRFAKPAQKGQKGRANERRRMQPERERARLNAG